MSVIRARGAERPARPACGAIMLALLLTLVGCTHPRPALEPAQSDAPNALQPDIWEMTIMAGRYGVMLSQARSILNLPEPTPRADDLFPADARDKRRERRALARYQAAVAREFFTDAARACAAARTPETIRALACSHAGDGSAALRKRPEPNLHALSARNAALGRLILPWWDAACALAPKPPAGEDPVCVME